MRKLSTLLICVLAISLTSLAHARDDEKQPSTKPARGWLGCKLAPNDDGAGIVIMEVMDKSPAQEAGLKEMDIITKLDGKSLEDIQAFVGRMRQSKPGEEIKFTVTREKEEKEIAVKLGNVPADMEQPKEEPKKD